MSSADRPRRVPGLRLRALAETLFDQATAHRILLPAIADLQHEVAESKDAPGAASVFARCRSYAAVWRTFAVCIVTRSSPSQWSTWRQLLVGAVAVLVVLTAGLLYGPLTRTGLPNLERLAVFLVPQALALSIPCSVLGAGLLGQWSPKQAGNPGAFVRGILAYSIIAAAASLIVMIFVLPAANQEFRQQVQAGIQMKSGRVPSNLVMPKGYPEMTVGELREVRRRATLQARWPIGEQASYYLHLKGALPAASLALCLLAIALAPWKRKQRFPGVAGLALSILTVFAYYLAFVGGRWLVFAMAAPAWLGAWAPPALSSVVAMLILWRGGLEGQPEAAGGLGPVPAPRG